MERMEDWIILQNIVARNYMHHREITQSARAWLAENGRNQGLRILDLGCGDCSMATTIFKGYTDVQYYGIDLCEQALRVARTNFNGHEWGVELLEGDINRLIQRLHGPFDIVIAGYSLHLLNEMEKSSILDNVRMLLASNGVVFLYDLLPRERENRLLYTRRLAQEIDQWNNLSPHLLHAFREKISTLSHPVSLTQWQSLSRTSRLGKAQLLYRDPSELFALMLLGE